MAAFLFISLQLQLIDLLVAIANPRGSASDFDIFKEYAGSESIFENDVLIILNHYFDDLDFFSLFLNSSWRMLWKQMCSMTSCVLWTNHVHWIMTSYILCICHVVNHIFINNFLIEKRLFNGLHRCRITLFELYRLCFICLLWISDMQVK